MDKNAVIGLILIGLILLLWPVYQAKVVGVGSRPTPQETAGPTENVAPLPQPVEPPPLSIPPPKTFGQPLSDEEVVPTDTVILENDRIRAVFSSLGGGTFLGWTLKEYKRYTGDSSTGEEEKVPIDLIPSQRKDRPNGAFRMVLPDESRIDFSRVPFRVIEQGPDRVLFVREVAGKGRLEREIRLLPGRYEAEVTLRFIPFEADERKFSIDLLWETGLASTEKNPREEDAYHQAYALQGGELMKVKKGDTGLREGDTQWMAIRNKYFIFTVIPQERPAKAVQLSVPERIKITDYKGNPIDWKTFQTRLLLRSEGGKVSYTVYFGPLEYRTIKAFGVSLEKTMDFGWALIRIFSIPLYHVLAFLGRLLGNYGLAIIVLSILIKILLHPLTQKSMRSMKEMQALQPKINALKEKYAKDPQRLNQEIMKLYKEHGVNPMGGCLPILLQMPVLFALFGLFRSTILFRQASFGPIKDLSAPDALIHVGGITLHLLPIFLGVSMILQQKRTVQDPTQKMMAYFMPIFMTVIFYTMSSGLNLYYLLFNLLSMAQEFLMKVPSSKKE